MAKPVFVLGMGRSGTTWISNLLLQHSRITGICRERGIHESSYFSVVDGRFGSLDDAVNFVEFAEVMAASYLFRSAGVDAAFLWERYPSSYAEIFRAAMDHHAEAAGEFYRRAGQWVADGELVARETVNDGLDSTVDAFLGLLSGRNTGKMVVNVRGE